MNDAPTTMPLLEGQLMSLNNELDQMDKSIGTLNELLDRIAVNTLKDNVCKESAVKSSVPVTNTYLLKLNSVGNGFNYQNSKLREIVERLSLLI